MPLEQRLNIKMSQRLIMTPSLQQAIKLLQLSKLELLEEITHELVENPILEEGTEVTQSESEVKSEAEAADGSPSPENTEKPEDREETFGDEFLDAFYENFLQSSYEPRAPAEEVELPSFEATLTKPQTLTDHLQWQLDATPSDEHSREIAAAIIGNLNDDGYLGATLEEIQAMGPYTAEETQRALEVVKGLDPPGVGAGDLRECLLIQLEHLGLSESLACDLVRSHFDLLQSHRYQALSQQMGCSMQEIIAAIEVIRHLDPSPGLRYNTERSQYVTPDVFIVKVEHGEYKVILNEDGLPRLRISRHYRRMLDRQNPDADREARSYIREKVRAAHRFIKSLDERQRTIFKVATSIIKQEKEFLDHGINRMRPLILRDVAEDIGMHESTVSRVVNNKYMHTPRGLFELRYFFHASVPGSSGEDISSLKVKNKIREIVTSENARNPLSDAHIVKLLDEEHGIKIARRTVAKYRGELKIPSSNDRRQPLA
jgi:RNA polymerase sigma-54 factor